MLCDLAQHLVELNGIIQKGLVLAPFELEEEDIKAVGHFHLVIKCPLLIQSLKQESLKQDVQAILRLKLLEVQVLPLRPVGAFESSEHIKNNLGLTSLKLQLP